MFKYYLKIFYSKNHPYKFNWSIIFPFLGTVISTLSIVLVYCIMTSVENNIKETVVSTDGEHRIYFKATPDNKSIDSDLKFVQQYLAENNIESQKMISRPAIIMFNNEIFFVTAFGIEEVKFLEKSFDISIYREDFKERILIGEELYTRLGSPNESDLLTILSPLDSRLFVNAKTFKCTKQRIDFQSPNSIKNISSEHIYMDYKSAEKIFSLAKPYIVVMDKLSDKKINYIKNNTSNIRIENWEERNPLFFYAIKIEKFLYSGFGIAILLIVGFNIYGLVNLIIFRKKNQLSLMMYVGANKRQVELIFYYNILLIGFLGSFIGGALSIFILKSGFLIEQNFLPSMITEIDIYYPVIYFSIIFNLLLLYLSSKISIGKSIKKIGALKSNAIES